MNKNPLEVFSYEPNPYFVTYILWSNSTGITGCPSLEFAKLRAQMLKKEYRIDRRGDRHRKYRNIQILQSIVGEKDNE